MSTRTEIIIIVAAFVVGVANFLLLGIIPLNYICLGVILFFAGRGVVRWFTNRRTAQSH